MKADIQFMYVYVEVSCDGKCNKAWGINSRPRNSDDTQIEDECLGEAPIDPGTTEGWDKKPKSLKEFPNRWCVRECERSKLKDK